MTLFDTYKFYLTFPVEGEIEVFPSNATLKWKKEEYKDESFFRTEVDTELVFDDKEVFAKLWELEKQRCSCNFLDIRIEKRCCKDDPYVDHYKGYIAFVDGNWDTENCKVTIKPRGNDAYACMIRSWGKDKNFLSITDRTNIKTVVGELVYIESYIEDFTPTGFGWVLKSYIEDDHGEEDDYDNRYDYRAVYFWVRECYDGTPPDGVDGWQLEDGKYYRTPSLSDPVFDYEFYEDNGFRKEMNRDVIDIDIDSGITFKAFLEFYFLVCFGRICSNFFNINPDGTAPDNYAYQKAEEELSDILVFQSFEVIAKTGDAIISGSDEQLAGVKKLKDLWKDLRLMFNLRMGYDEDSQCLRIEHVSYFSENTKVLDLTGEKFKDCLAGTGNYRTNKANIPRYERLKYKYDTGDRDFNNGYIEYDDLCSDPNEDTNDKDTPNTIKCFLNDVGSIYHNKEIEKEIEAINNITLLAMKDGSIIKSSGAITGKPKLNAPLASANLIANYWLWDRPHCQGKVNGKQTSFITTRPVRDHGKVKVDLNCKTIDSLDPSSVKVRTLFGETTIKSMTYEEPSGSVELDLIF